MAGFWGGFADGLKNGQQMVMNVKRQQSLDAEEADRSKARGMRDAREAAVAESVAAGTQPARAGEEGPVPEKRAPIWQSLETAAQRRLQAGDVDGYEAMTTKSIALKTMHFGTKLNQAALTGDPGEIASVMNEMSPGYKFNAQLDPQTGEVKGSVEGPQGSIPMSFKSVQEMAAATRAFATNGNVTATFQEQAKQNAELALKGAQTKQAQAQTGFIQANTSTENAMRPLKVEDAEAGIGLKGAQTANQLADASKSARDKLSPVEQQYQGLINIGVDAETARAIVSGKGDRAKSREQAIIDVAGKLAAAPPPIGAEPMSAEEATRRATQIVDGAAQAGGTSRVGSGAGMRVPGAAPAAPAGRGTKAAVKPPEMDGSEARRAAEIKAAVKAGKMSREDALSELKALGFQ